MTEDMDYAPKELFCKDFDISCFELIDPAGCKKGKSALIRSVYYFSLPVTAICPISDMI